MRDALPPVQLSIPDKFSSLSDPGHSGVPAQGDEHFKYARAHRGPGHRHPQGLGYFPERYEDVDSRGNGAYRGDDRGWVDLHLSTDANKMFSWGFGINGLQEHLGDWTLGAQAGVTIRPISALAIDLDVRYKRRRGWLVYQGGRNFGAYDGTEWQPGMTVNWFMAPNHQLKLSVQWAGVRARENGFFAVPFGDGDLVDAARTLPDHDFTVSLVTTQLRYRWEIAPLTDLFIVYNRGNRLPNQFDGEFVDLFEDAFDDPIIDAFVAKLRYRFGN